MADKTLRLRVKGVIHLDVFGVSEQRSHGGNMAGTNAKLGGYCLVGNADRREPSGLLE